MEVKFCTASRDGRSDCNTVVATCCVARYASIRPLVQIPVWYYYKSGFMSMLLMTVHVRTKSPLRLFIV